MMDPSFYDKQRAEVEAKAAQIAHERLAGVATSYPLGASAGDRPYDSTPATPTSAGLVAAADQLRAALIDVHEAWNGFVTGSESPTSGGSQSDAVPDRIEYSVATMMASATALRQLAINIRERTG